ncbi:unnamed protein product, partial [Closterium sp. Naga37s-1]
MHVETSHNSLPPSGPTALCATESKGENEGWLAGWGKGGGGVGADGVGCMLRRPITLCHLLDQPRSVPQKARVSGEERVLGGEELGGKDGGRSVIGPIRAGPTALCATGSKASGFSDWLQVKHDCVRAISELSPHFSITIRPPSNHLTPHSSTLLPLSFPSDWLLVEHDCLRAIEHDKKSVKAHFYLGTALTELARYPEAAHVLERAVEIIRDDEVLGSSRGNLNDVWNAMATARYRQWEVESSMRKRKQQQLRAFLGDLLKEKLQADMAAIT